MSTLPTVLGFDGSAGPRSEHARQPGLFRRTFERWSEVSRQRGGAHIEAYLQGLGNERLADLGFTPDCTRALREKGAFDSYWL